MTLDPHSFRFQIREHRRIPDPLGFTVRHEFGGVLWDEPVEAVERSPLSFRESTVRSKADEMVERVHVATSTADEFDKRGHDVAIGRVSVSDPSLFELCSLVCAEPEYMRIALCGGGS